VSGKSLASFGAEPMEGPAEAPARPTTSRGDMPGPDRRLERRVAERCPVEEAAVVRAVAARNQPRPPIYAVTIVDVSLKGAGLRAPRDIELRPGWAVELGIDGQWSRCRIVWSQLDFVGTQVAGVEFAEAVPGFVPALLRWLDREEALSS
jgi:hypothetical protein